MGQEMFKARMAEFIKDKRLLEGFTPKFGVGCRRITPGDPYMMAIQEPNVDVHFTAVASCTEDGVVGEDGVEKKCDTVVCATGFDVSYRPRFPLVGKGGADLKVRNWVGGVLREDAILILLQEKWKICPESYLGLAIPEFPNFITFIGPTWPVENGSGTYTKGQNESCSISHRHLLTLACSDGTFAHRLRLCHPNHQEDAE